MACRVGITTRPDQRKIEWQRKHPSLRKWRLRGPYRTKASAQAEEDRLAKRLGCVAHHGGGRRKRADWYVYYFEF